MLQETRFYRICNLLDNFNQVSTEQIMKELEVSRETVRRDLVELEAQGLLRRVHGGVISTTFSPEPPLHERNLVRAKEKKAIARATAKLFSSGQSILIDSGSTTTFLAEELRALSGLTIITNSLNLATIMSSTDSAHMGSKPKNEVILLGGNMGELSQATYGEKTIDEIYRYQADFAVLSPVGIDARYGASSFNQHENSIARAMVHQAKQFVALADHSKIGIVSRIVYAPINEISILVTDQRSTQSPEFESINQAIKKVIVG